GRVGARGAGPGGRGRSGGGSVRGSAAGQGCDQRGKEQDGRQVSETGEHDGHRRSSAHTGWLAVSVPAGTMAVMSKAPPTLVIITGEEELLVDRVIARALAAARRQDPDVERREAPAAGLSVGDFTELGAPSLFAEPRLVVIRGAQEASKELAAAVLD